jgi:ferredoxin-NADP reductase
VGDSLQIEGIGGNFTPIERPDPKLLLLSAGSGITPMMSISRWVYDTGTARDIVFFHGARDRPDVIFARELQLLERRNPDFHLAISLTRCQDPGWRGATGRLDEKLLLAIAPDYRERAVYVCGPDSFMGGVKELLTSMDFPMANYHQESFGERKRVRGEKVEGGAVVVLARTGKEIVADGEGSLLELVEAEGIEIGSACRSGSCGTCKARLLEGRVSHDGEPSGLDREESERGYILPCIARPLERVVLDL